MATTAAKMGENHTEPASNAINGGSEHLSYAEALTKPKESSPGPGDENGADSLNETPSREQHSQNGTANGESELSYAEVLSKPKQSSSAPSYSNGGLPNLSYAEAEHIHRNIDKTSISKQHPQDSGKGNNGQEKGETGEVNGARQDDPQPKPNDEPTVKTTPAGTSSYAQVTEQASKQKPGDVRFPKLSENRALAHGTTNGESKKVKGHEDDKNQHRRYSQDATVRYGVRWASLTGISFARRMQTFAVLLHCSLLLTSVPAFFFCCGNPLLWIFIIPYLLHVVFSSPGSNGKLAWRSNFFRSLWIWKYFADFFPAKLIKTHDLPPNRKYIFGYHPHGIISHGAWAAFATEGLGFNKEFPGITNSLLTLDSNFNIPFYREYILMAGLSSVSRVSIKNHLSMGGHDGKGSGRAVTIVVGGARESLEAQPGTLRLVIKDRFGFVKMAIRTGAHLVPVLGFGENNLYDQLSGQEHPRLHKLQLLIMRIFKFTLPFMRGRGIFNYDVGLLPYRQPLNIVVGKPIKVVKCSNEDLVDSAEVERLHGLYCEELQRLWDTYKDEYAQGRKEELKFLG